jgi:hypothetical protein
MAFSAVCLCVRDRGVHGFTKDEPFRRVRYLSVENYSNTKTVREGLFILFVFKQSLLLQ